MKMIWQHDHRIYFEGSNGHDVAEGRSKAFDIRYQNQVSLVSHHGEKVLATRFVESAVGGHQSYLMGTLLR